MTLSCADLRWNELISIISKQKGESLSEAQINNLSYFERCSYLNINPVLLARHFQYRVEVFFKEIVVDGPLGKVTYYAIRVEFQVRGSPHIHSFLWVLNAPVLTNDNIDEYITFVDAVIKAYVPDIDENSELHKLVTTYQIHSHSKSCRKYKNQDCRYHLDVSLLITLLLLFRYQKTYLILKKLDVSKNVNYYLIKLRSILI